MFIREAGLDFVEPQSGCRFLAGVDVVRLDVRRPQSGGLGKALLLAEAEMGVDIPAVQSKNDNFSGYAQDFFCCFFRQKLFIEQNFSINFQK